MSADSKDGFEYERAAGRESEELRRRYWDVAIGLQQVDGLETSSYLRRAADGYVCGERTLEETGELVRSYHQGPEHADTREADLVSQRITELLARAPFVLAPEIIPQIHRYLFQDLDAELYRPGEFKTERMVKAEPVLNGDSVLYADPLAYDMSLKAYFNGELAKTYTAFDGSELADFVHGIAFLWQIHPFYEGNTRTTAVFSALYLNYLGFDVTNEPFAERSRFYRDALVRAMYRNAAAGVFPDESHLVMFYENLLGKAHHVLDGNVLKCQVLFDNPQLLRNIGPDEAAQPKDLSPSS